MSYLYLNFYDNLNQGSKSWDDFFTLSLTEQYDSIKRRIGRFAPSTLQELVSACCPLTYQTKCKAVSKKKSYMKSSMYKELALWNGKKILQGA